MFSILEDAKENIPETVWSDADYFNSTISDAILAITKLSYEKMLAVILSSKISEWPIKERSCLWLALNYAYIELTNEVRLLISGLFNLSPSISFVLAATFGDELYFEKFYGDCSTSFRDFTQENHDLALEKAEHNRANPGLISRLKELAAQYKNSMPPEEHYVNPGDFGMFKPSAIRKNISQQNCHHLNPKNGVVGPPPP